MIKKLTYVLGACALSACLSLLLVPDTQAVGTAEMEINFYSCPAGFSSLSECTWNGMLFRDCHGNRLIEGTLGGNYKVQHSESCSSGGSSTGCFVWFNVQQGWTATVCVPWFPV